MALAETATGLFYCSIGADKMKASTGFRVGCRYSQFRRVYSWIKLNTAKQESRANW